MIAAPGEPSARSGSEILADGGHVGRALATLEAALDRAPSVDVSWIEPPPAEAGWALAADMLRLLTALVETRRPRHVVEFGSGTSTVVLARIAARVGRCVVTSLESDPACAAQSADALSRIEGRELVSLQLAPLVARVRGEALYPAYLVDRAKVASPRPAEIILIDGPPAALGGRAGMLYQALDYADCGSIILLDDAEREDERHAVEMWRAQLGDAIEVCKPEGFERGLAVIVLAAPTKARIRTARGRSASR